MNNMLKVIIASSILCIGLIGSSYTLSRFYLRMEKEKIITVKGYSQQRLTSDKASLTARLSVQSPTIAEAYNLLQAQSDQLKSLVLAKETVELNADNVDLNKVFQVNDQGHQTNTVDYYMLSQAFTMDSADVDKVKTLSQEIGGLFSQGFQIGVSGPFYYITDLSDTKMELLAQATHDGYQRALLMAKNSGGKVGRLVEAQQGVFQITTPDSTDVSSYGIYDTSTIIKDIKAVVTLKYLIE